MFFQTIISYVSLLRAKNIIQNNRGPLATAKQHHGTIAWIFTGISPVFPSENIKLL